MRRVLALLVSCLLLSACAGERDPGPRAGDSTVDVDTPALRTLKTTAGIEPCDAGNAPTPAKDALPEVTLPCLGGGRAVKLSGLRGPLVINLFAQWCGPCRTELPFYQRLHATAKGKVRVLGVDYLDTQPARALELVKQAGVTYPLVADPAGDLRTELKIRGLPGVVLVDASGKVADIEFRAFRSYAELRDLVEQELGVVLPA